MANPKWLLILAAVCLLGRPATAGQEARQAQHAADEVVPPMVVAQSQKPPVFPPAAKAARFSGTVVVRTTVGIDGTVSEAVAAECSHPNLGFEEAAVEAVKQWRFRPAMLRGDPVEYTTSFRLHFGRRIAGGMPAPAHWVTRAGARGVDSKGERPGETGRPRVAAPRDPTVPSRRD